MSKENRDSLLEEVRASVDELARRAGISAEKAFAAWYATNFLDVDEDAALEAASVDGAEDQGIDFLYADDANERIILLQAHLPQADQASPKKKMDALAAAIPALDSPSSFKKAGRPDLAILAEECTQRINELSYDGLAGLVSLGRPSDSIHRAVPTLNKSGRFNPFDIFYHACDTIEEEYAVIKSNEEGGVPEDEIEFCDGHYFEHKGDYGRAYVGSIAGKELHRLYQAHRDRLFARNVRLYLGTRKGSINEQIVETAKTAPGRFWALNNGITIVADTIKPAPNKDGHFKITRFSIVNGCQTTASLSKAEPVDSVRVLVRLVAAKQDVVTDIVRYNNTQNAVKIWTVRAADQVQRRLVESFHSINISYAPKPSSGRARGKKAKATIQLDRLAQYIAAIRGLVVEAVKEKSELFDKHYQVIFPHNIRPEDAYMAWLLGCIADDMRQERLDALKTSDSADTSTPFLGVAGTYWIVFFAHKIIASFNPAPIRVKMETMRTDQFRGALEKYVDAALDYYFDLSSDTYDPDAHGSQRQALRSPRFFQKVNQKLDNKIASMKARKNKLPNLEHVAKSIPASTDA